MGYNILIVDDSATTRAMIKRCIRMTDLPIEALHEAENGVKGLLLLARTRMDLVLADLNMPQMDGFEMLKRIRGDASLCKVPVVIVSANPSAEQFAQMQQSCRCIGKPFTPEAIRDVITQSLEVAHA